jgi:hypothetical protein
MNQGLGVAAKPCLHPFPGGAEAASSKEVVRRDVAS